MDTTRFTSDAPGRLVPTVTRIGRVAGFIPHPLPCDWQMPDTTRALLAQAWQAIARLDDLGQAIPDPEAAVALLQLRDAIWSSASKRNYTTTGKLLRFEPLDDGTGDPVSAWRNALNYRRTLRSGQEFVKSFVDFPLRTIILQLHAGLFAGQPQKTFSPGCLRHGPMQIGVKARYVPPPYEYVVPCLYALERWMNGLSEIDPLIQCFMAHYQFVSIHPFKDGNGRVGRILLTLTINYWLNLSRPLLYLSPFMVRHKRRYVESLFRVNTHGDWEPWINFCLKTTVEAAGDAVARIRSLYALKRRLAQKLPERGKLIEQIINQLFATPVISEPQLRSQYGAGYEMARTALDRLIALGFMRKVKTRLHPPHFIAPAVIKLVYTEKARRSQQA